MKREKLIPPKMLAEAKIQQMDEMAIGLLQVLKRKEPDEWLFVCRSLLMFAMVEHYDYMDAPNTNTVAAVDRYRKALKTLMADLKSGRVEFIPGMPH